MIFKILFVFAIIGTISSIMAFAATMNGTFLTTLLMCCIMDVVFYVLYRKSKYFVNEKRKEQEQRDNFLTTLSAEHQAGLPLAEGMQCTIVKENDKFRIVSGGNDFSLVKAKITDICLKTDTEIQSQYVSSVGGAIAGGMVFGPLGAIVGGRAKEKKTTTTEHYLIFTYRSNENISYVSFLVKDVWKAGEWIKEFHASNSGRAETIEL